MGVYLTAIVFTNQVHLTALWEACEEQKRKESELRKAIEYERRMLELERSADVQVTKLPNPCITVGKGLEIGSLWYACPCACR